MNKTKVDFLSDILASKKMDITNKERFLKLATLELKNIENSENHIVERIEALEKKMSEKESIEEKNRPLVHSPQKTSKHLKLFKEGNKLKWITHIYPNTNETKFDYAKITKDAISEFNVIKKEIPFRLRGLIKMFLQGDEENPDKTKFYYLDNSYETWWSAQILDWCKKNPGLHPDTDDYISDNIITPFKKSIEIRDGKDLKQAIQHKLRQCSNKIFDDLDIDFTGIKNGTRFYTGVDQVMTGIAQLFNPIKKRKSISKKVFISSSIEEINDQYVSIIKIVHLNSVNNEVEYNDSTEIIQGDLTSAKEILTSYCDWEIITDFKNGSYIFNPLSILPKSRGIKSKERVNGFTHKLIFY